MKTTLQADLQTMCARIIVVHAQISANTAESDVAEHPDWPEYRRLEDDIVRRPARTPAELAAKARAAFVACDLHSVDSMPGVWARAILGDAVRVGEAATR